MPKVDLPYAINDADNHFNEPPDLYERFIDPKHRDLAIRYVTDVDGRELQLFAGRPVEVRLEPGHVLRRRAGQDARRRAVARG